MATSNQVENVQQFERRSGTYEHSWMQPLFFDRVHRLVLDYAGQATEGRAPGCILDIGCGTGRLLRKAGARWPAARLVGVDPAEGMVAIARRLTPSATFGVGAAEALPIEDGFVDLALSTLSIHHWQDRAVGLRDVTRVLRPGGCFVLADVSPLWGLSAIIHHFGPNDPDIVREAFAQAGLHPTLQRRVTLLWLIVTAGQKGLS
jgi:ubiquinone/menaquinone biosynthesis C-methylase UbiE